MKMERGGGTEIDFLETQKKNAMCGHNLDSNSNKATIKKNWGSMGKFEHRLSVIRGYKEHVINCVQSDISSVVMFL